MKMTIREYVKNKQRKKKKFVFWRGKLFFISARLISVNYISASYISVYFYFHGSLPPLGKGRLLRLKAKIEQPWQERGGLNVFNAGNMKAMRGRHRPGATAAAAGALAVAGSTYACRVCVRVTQRGTLLQRKEADRR